MTRQDILDQYEVNKYGIITSPGKFESEMLYIPYFWEYSMDGCESLDWANGISIYVVEIENRDRAEFPELSADIFAIAMRESDQGFVNAESLTESELDKLRETCDEDHESDDEPESDEESDE